MAKSPGDRLERAEALEQITGLQARTTAWAGRLADHQATVEAMVADAARIELAVGLLGAARME